LAIYHLSIKIITRGKGRSAVAAAAYRAGETIKSEYDGITHDYTRKRGIAHTEIQLPENAPIEYSNRAVLWNAVEKTERQRNAQLAREIEIALPAELTIGQNISLARRYAKENFVDKGMCADVCVHDKGDGNPHAHIMLTMRPLNSDGSWGAKIKKAGGKPIYTTDWNEHSKAEEWRKAWADTIAPPQLREAGRVENPDRPPRTRRLADGAQRQTHRTGRHQPPSCGRQQPDKAVAREAKTAERDALYAQYDALKAETQKVEQIKRGIDEILRGETAERSAATERERTAKRAHDPEL
jgi:hypothetical protein